MVSDHAEIQRQQQKRARRVIMLLLAAPTVLYLLMLIAPLIVTVVISFGERASAGGYTPSFTFEQYGKLATRSKAFTNTIWMAAMGTILCVLVAYPLAYNLATRAGERSKSVYLALIIIPFWTSFLVRTYAWILILGNRGIPSILENLGLVENLVLLNTPFAVMLGIVYNFLPLICFPIYVSLEQLDKGLLEASKDLGASRIGTFFQITLPLTAPGLVTGSMLVFILLMGEFLIPALLGGGKVFFIGNALIDLFLQSRNWPFGAAISVTLTLIMVTVVSLYVWFTMRSRTSEGKSLL